MSRLKSAKFAVSAVLAIGVATTPAFAAIGDEATFTFSLPSTASQSPPYDPVATITLEEVLGGVEFLLTPNWSNPGFSNPSKVVDLDFVYKGVAPTSFANLSGAPVDSWSYETNQSNLESGYTTADQHIKISYETANNSNRFDNDYLVSKWKFSGVLTDFTGTQATSTSKPTPIFGVMSVSPFSGDSSNWVTMATITPVPEPETYAMLLAGLGLMGFVARCRKLKLAA